jgi:hypothetical protein
LNGYYRKIGPRMLWFLRCSLVDIVWFRPDCSCSQLLAKSPASSVSLPFV